MPVVPWRAHGRVWHHCAVLDYGWYTELGNFAFDWSTQADEWLHRLTGLVSSDDSTIELSERHFGSATTPFIRASLKQGDVELDTVLLIGRSTDAVHVYAAGHAAPDDDLIGQLAAAAQAASAQLGEEGDDHHWTAIVGYTSERIGGMEKRLAAEVTVGPMRLESTDTILIEPDTSHQYSLSAWAIQASVPIRVYGSSRGYAWQAANVRAARDLHILCGLLSVALEAPIMVRDAAAPLAWGERQVPACPPWYRGGPGGEAADQSARTVEAAAPPAWLDSAWARTQAAPYLVAALDAFLEGVHVAQRHPSLAAVAFTASVETIATRLYKLQSCAACGTRFGLGRAFKAALRQVVDEDEAKILDSVYAARSKTVHSGRLHGGETIPGVIFGGSWNADPSSDFRWQILWRLQRATGQLLKWALTADLPPRELLAETETPRPS
jgi:hypothetical protein